MSCCIKSPFKETLSGVSFFTCPKKAQPAYGACGQSGRLGPRRIMSRTRDDACGQSGRLGPRRIMSRTRDGACWQSGRLRAAMRALASPISPGIFPFIEGRWLAQ